MLNTHMDFEQRLATSTALRRFLQATGQFEVASQALSEANDELRRQLSRPSRFVSEVNMKQFLVTSDGQGQFEVEEIAVL